MADDFIVPEGEAWEVKQVRVNGDKRGELPFRVRFYADNSDQPGALPFDADNLSDFSESPRGPTNSDFDINLGQSATLVGGGKYWLAMRTGTPTAFEFLWGGTGLPSTPPIDRRPQLSSNGTDWVESRNLTVFAFALFGTVGPPPNFPPDCSAAAPSIDALWPANKKLVPIDVLGVTDPDGDPITITIDAIFQDEPTDTGGAKLTPDGFGIGTSTAEVRAERVGSGNGRVYHISFTADDGQGGSCSSEVLVGVPHNLQGDPAVDDGALYDSTVSG
jgi:hypothetical protein